MRRRDHALINRHDPSVIRDLEDQIESMKANIDYVQESIAESQQNIMQIEESKVCSSILPVINNTSNYKKIGIKRGNSYRKNEEISR